MFSKLERFPAEKTIGPPVGAYNPKFPAKRLGPVSFKRSPREKATKFNGPAVGQYDPKYPGYKYANAPSMNGSRLTNKLKRRSQSADHLHSLESFNDLTISVESMQFDEEKEILLSRINQQIEELAKKDEELKDLRQNIFKQVVHSEQETKKAPLMKNNFTLTDVDQSEIVRVQRVNELFLELSALKEDRNKIKFESETLRNEFLALLPQLNEQAILVDVLSTDTNTVQKEFVCIAAEHDVLRCKLNEIMLELDKKSNELHIVRMNNLILSQDIAKLMNNLQVLKDSEIKAQTEVKNLRHTFDVKEAELLDKVSFMENALEKSKENDVYWTEVKAGFDKILIESDEQMVCIRSENEHLKSKLVSLLESSKYLTEVIHSLKKGQADFKEDVVEFNLSTTIDFETFKQKMEELCQLLRTLSQENNILKKDKYELLYVVEENKTKGEKNEEKLLLVEDKCRRFEEDAQQFKEAVERLNNELESVKTEKAMIEVDLFQLRQKLDLLTDEKQRLADDHRNIIEHALAFCNENDLLCREKLQLEEILQTAAKSNEQSVQLLREALNDVKMELRSLNDSHTNLCQRYDSLKKQKDGDLEQKVVALKTENSNLKCEVLTFGEELKRLWDSNEHMSSNLQLSRQESLQYKSQLNDLIEKIEPFKEQLDLYQTERNVLSARENESDEVLKALLEKYASLMSHQNQKQKIHHVNKLKDDMLKLRQEKHEINKENAKLKCQVDSLQDKLVKLEGKRRFDPSKAFHFEDKENHPLKSVNQNM